MCVHVDVCVCTCYVLAPNSTGAEPTLARTCTHLSMRTRACLRTSTHASAQTHDHHPCSLEHILSHRRAKSIVNPWPPHPRPGGDTCYVVPQRPPLVALSLFNGWVSITPLTTTARTHTCAHTPMLPHLYYHTHLRRCNWEVSITRQTKKGWPNRRPRRQQSLPKKHWCVSL